MFAVCDHPLVPVNATSYMLVLWPFQCTCVSRSSLCPVLEIGYHLQSGVSACNLVQGDALPAALSLW
jgi:hypothetical protein